jgi:cytochrome c-type biogenesis protein CcmH
VWVRLSALLVAATLATASLSAGAAPDPLDARVDRLAQELRCVVCQNQSVADSPAGIADDLKAHVRERLAAGASDDQVRAELVERYGEFVLYRPPLRGGTALLWFGPALLAAAGAVLLARLALRRGPLVDGPADTDTDTDTDTANATANAGATCADTTTGAAAEHAATGASA